MFFNIAMQHLKVKVLIMWLYYSFTSFQKIWMKHISKEIKQTHFIKPTLICFIFYGTSMELKTFYELNNG